MHLLRVRYASVMRPVSVLGSVCGLLLSACAHHGEPAQKPSEAELCASLQDVVAQSDTRFKKFRTTPTIAPFSGMTRWETRPVFPDSQCEVLEWVGGRINYVCTWRQGDEALARETYQRNTARIASCLDQTWARSETQGQTGGATTFGRPGKPTQVVMRYFKPRPGLGRVWETSLTIGDEVTAEPR